VSSDTLFGQSEFSINGKEGLYLAHVHWEIFKVTVPHRSKVTPSMKGRTLLSETTRL
jgi:hypothetical protein